MDIWIAAFLGLATFLLGYLGFHVTVYPPQSEPNRNRYKAAFAIVGLLSMVLIIWQAVRNSQAQTRIENLIREAGTGPTISFVARRSITFRHNLNTLAPQLTCYDDNGNSLATFQGWKIVDANTATLEFSAPQNGTCSAKR